MPPRLQNEALDELLSHTAILALQGTCRLYLAQSSIIINVATMDGDPPPSAARAFIDEVRQAHVASGKKLTGPSSLADRQRLAIRAAVAFGAATAPDSSITPGIEKRMLERFEEMARRTEHAVPEELRFDILSLLVKELSVNHRFLGGSPARLVSVTILRGAVGQELSKTFPEFVNIPSIFTHAAVHSPADPRGALRKVRRTIAALAADAEFAQFRDMPSIFMRAAVHNPADPKGALRKVKKTAAVGSSRVDLQACKLEYSIVSPK